MSDENNKKFDLWSPVADEVPLWAPEHLAVFMEEAYITGNDYVGSLLANIVTLRKAAGLDTAADPTKIDALLQKSIKYAKEKAAAAVMAQATELQQGVKEGN